MTLLKDAELFDYLLWITIVALIAWAIWGRNHG